MSSSRNDDPALRMPIMEGAPPPREMRPPRAEWDRSPWNRWSFQHVRELLPTATVRRGGVVSPLRYEERDLGGLRFRAPDGAETTLDAMIDATFTDGLLIMLDGAVVHESYHNGMDARTPHLAQSVSKSVTSAAFGWLVEHGLIDPMAPVTEYLPELSATAWYGASMRHVLDMTSGVRFNEDYEAPDSDIAKMDAACGWKDRQSPDWPETMWDQILSLTVREAEHGERFSYRSIETDVMAHAMERVTGQRLPQIISERLWDPLGAEEDAYISVDPAGYGLACGGFCATLRDFARLGLAIMQEGEIGGRQAVPASWVADIRRGGHGLANDYLTERFPSGCYRNQFWVEDRGRETVLCLGIFGQMIYVAPELGLVAAKLSSQPLSVDGDALALTIAGLKAVAAAGRG